MSSVERSKIFVIMILAVVGMVFSARPVPASDLSVDEIMKRVDGNQYVESSHSTSTMTIISGKREMVKQMEAWGVSGKDGSGGKALVHFINPQDRGTKYLKVGDELWMFFPDAEDLVKISGHMLRQGIMGSDFSYRDALESEKMTELYDFSLAGIEKYRDVNCYVILATAKEGADVSYHTRKIWVDAGRFVGLKEELYAPSGKLLKVSRVEEVREIDGRYLAARIVMEDKLKKDSATTFTIDRIELNVPISDDIFSLNSLMR